MSSARTQQQRPHDRLPARTRAITHAYAHHAHGLVPHAAGSTTGKALTSGASRAVRPGSVREAVRARPAGCTRARPQKSSSSRKEPNEAKNSIPSCHAADMPVRVVEKQCTCDQGVGLRGRSSGYPVLFEFQAKIPFFESGSTNKVRSQNQKKKRYKRASVR